MALNKILFSNIKIILINYGEFEESKAFGSGGAEMRKKARMDGPQRSRANRPSQLASLRAQAHQGRPHHEAQAKSALSRKGKTAPRGQAQGQPHRRRKTQRYQGKQNAHQDPLGPQTKSPQKIAEEVQRGQENRPHPLPQVLPRLQGQPVQEQNSPHRGHLQGEDQKSGNPEVGGPAGRPQAEEPRTQKEESRKATETLIGSPI